MKLVKIAASLITCLALSVPAHAGLIDFESDTNGLKANNFKSNGDSVISFSDTQGGDLQILSGYSEVIGRGLAVFSDDTSRLLMNFSASASSLSLTFGNDDSSFATPSTRAWLELFNNGVSVGLASVVVNRDDLPNQIISATASSFNSALFWYGDENGNAITLIEAVDNINYTLASTDVPEPASMALIGAGIFAMGLRRRRPK